MNKPSRRGFLKRMAMAPAGCAALATSLPSPGHGARLTRQAA